MSGVRDPLLENLEVDEVEEELDFIDEHPNRQLFHWSCVSIAISFVVFIVLFLLIKIYLLPGNVSESSVTIHTNTKEQKCLILNLWHKADVEFDNYIFTTPIDSRLGNQVDEHFRTECIVICIV